MPEPSIEILGVYRPSIPEETYREQWQVTASDEDTKEHFDQLVLIEAIVHNPDGRFTMMEFRQQPTWTDDPKSSLVAYDEALLSADGELLIERTMDCVHGTGSLRFAFYLHCYDPTQPLMTPYGPIQCPPIDSAPERLMALVPYTACS
jgi:hypothetical protein